MIYSSRSQPLPPATIIPLPLRPMSLENKGGTLCSTPFLVSLKDMETTDDTSIYLSSFEVNNARLHNQNNKTWESGALYSPIPSFNTRGVRCMPRACPVSTGRATYAPLRTTGRSTFYPQSPAQVRFHNGSNRRAEGR